MQKVTMRSVAHGMNNKLNPRACAKYISDTGDYDGPLAEARNVDRSAGVWGPRKGDALVSLDTASNPLGMTVYRALSGNTLWYDGAEMLMIARSNGSSTDIRVKYAPIDNPSTQTLMLGNLTGVTAVRFVDLGDYILAYNDSGYNNVFDLKDDYFRVSSTNNYRFTSGSDGTITVEGGKNAYALKQWEGKYIVGMYTWTGSPPVATYYYNRKITSVVSDEHTTKITVDPVMPVGTYGLILYSPVIMGERKFAITQPSFAVTPTEDGAGNLIGTYQYACSFGTSDNEESNLGPWSSNITVNNKKILVNGLPVATNAQWTSLASTNVDRIHVYRRGGSLGSTALRVKTIYIPNRYPLNDDQTAGGIRQYVAGFNDPTNSYNASYPADTGSIAFHTGELTGWPTSGWIQVVNKTTGDLWEWVGYTGISGDSLTGISRDLWGATGKQDWENDGLVFLSTFEDNIADSDLLTAEDAPEDHGIPPSKIKSATMTGSRLFVVDGNSPNKLWISNTESQRYFNDEDWTATGSFADQWTGGCRTIGDKGSIYKVITFQPDTVIAFKSNAVYAITGNSLWTMQINKIENLPGTTSPDSVCVADTYVFWVSGKQAWIWDGDTFLADLTLSLNNLETNLASVTAMVGYYYKNKIVLHYTISGDSLVNSRYIEWDFTYPVTQGVNRLVPSPTIGDNMQCTCVCISDIQPDRLRIYGGRPNGIYSLWRTVAPTAGDMVLKWPDMPLDHGTRTTYIDKYYIRTFLESGMSAYNLTITPILDGVAQTPYTRQAGTGLREIIDRAATTTRGISVGVQISTPLSGARGTDKTSYLEEVALELNTGGKAKSVT